MKFFKKNKRAYTLVESSIVLIIISIAVLATVSARSLIINSRIISICSIVKKVKVASITFEEIFDRLPGDISSENGTSNFKSVGNEDSFIGDGDPLNKESINFFVQLYKSNLLEETYINSTPPSSISKINSSYYPETKFAGLFVYVGASDFNGTFNRANRFMLVSNTGISPFDGKVASMYNCKFDNCDPTSGNIISLNVNYDYDTTTSKNDINFINEATASSTKESKILASCIVKDKNGKIIYNRISKTSNCANGTFELLNKDKDANILIGTIDAENALTVADIIKNETTKHPDKPDDGNKEFTDIDNEFTPENPEDAKDTKIQCGVPTWTNNTVDSETFKILTLSNSIYSNIGSFEGFPTEPADLGQSFSAVCEDGYLTDLKDENSTTINFTCVQPYETSNAFWVADAGQCAKVSNDLPKCWSASGGKTRSGNNSERYLDTREEQIDGDITNTVRGFVDPECCNIDAGKYVSLDLKLKRALCEKEGGNYDCKFDPETNIYSMNDTIYDEKWANRPDQEKLIKFVKLSGNEVDLRCLNLSKLDMSKKVPGDANSDIAGLTDVKVDYNFTSTNYSKSFVDERDNLYIHKFNNAAAGKILFFSDRPSPYHEENSKNIKDGANLRGVNFSGLKSSLIYFAHAPEGSGNVSVNLSNADFSNSYFAGVFFCLRSKSGGGECNVNLTGANFSNSHFQELVFNAIELNSEANNHVKGVGAKFNDSLIEGRLVFNHNYDGSKGNSLVDLSNSNFSNLFVRDRAYFSFNSHNDLINLCDSSCENMETENISSGNQITDLSNVDFSKTIFDGITLFAINSCGSKGDPSVKLNNANFRGAQFNNSEMLHFASNISHSSGNPLIDLTGADFRSLDEQETVFNNRISFAFNICHSSGNPKSILAETKFNGLNFPNLVYFGLNEDNSSGNPGSDLTRADFSSLDKSTTRFGNEIHFAVNRVQSNGNPTTNLNEAKFNGVEFTYPIFFALNQDDSYGYPVVDLSKADFSSTADIDTRTMEVIFAMNRMNSKGNPKVIANGAKFRGVRFDGPFRGAENTDNSNGNPLLDLSKADFTSLNSKNTIFGEARFAVNSNSNGNPTADLESAYFDNAEMGYTYFAMNENNSHGDPSSNLFNASFVNTKFNSMVAFARSIDSYGNPGSNLTNAKFNNARFNSETNFGYGTVRPLVMPGSNVTGAIFTDATFSMEPTKENTNFCKVGATVGALGSVCDAGTNGEMTSKYVYNPYLNLASCSSCAVWNTTSHLCRKYGNSGIKDSNGEIVISDDCKVENGNKIFTYSGAVEKFTVPNGATSVFARVYGGQGGSSTNNNREGGLGGYSYGYITVTPNSILDVIVGGRGMDCAGGAGGGGSAVVYDSKPMIVAGGGGGTGDYIKDVELFGGTGGGGNNDGGNSYGNAGMGGNASGSGGGGSDGIGGNYNTGLNGGGNGADAHDHSTTCEGGYGFGKGGYGNTTSYAGGGGGYSGGGTSGEGGGGGSGHIDESFVSDFGGENGNNEDEGMIVLCWGDDISNCPTNANLDAKCDAPTIENIVSGENENNMITFNNTSMFNFKNFVGLPTEQSALDATFVGNCSNGYTTEVDGVTTDKITFTCTAKGKRAVWVPNTTTQCNKLFAKKCWSASGGMTTVNESENGQANTMKATIETSYRGFVDTDCCNISEGVYVDLDTKLQRALCEKRGGEYNCTSETENEYTIDMTIYNEKWGAASREAKLIEYINLSDIYVDLKCLNLAGIDMSKTVASSTPSDVRDITDYMVVNSKDVADKTSGKYIHKLNRVISDGSKQLYFSYRPAPLADKSTINDGANLTRANFANGYFNIVIFGGNQYSSGNVGAILKESKFNDSRFGMMNFAINTYSYGNFQTDLSYSDFSNSLIEGDLAFGINEDKTNAGGLVNAEGANFNGIRINSIYNHNYDSNGNHKLNLKGADFGDANIRNILEFGFNKNSTGDLVVDLTGVNFQGAIFGIEGGSEYKYFCTNKEKSSGNSQCILKNANFKGTNFYGNAYFCVNEDSSSGNQTCDLTNANFGPYENEAGDKVNTRFVNAVEFGANRLSSSGEQILNMDGVNFNGTKFDNYLNFCMNEELGDGNSGNQKLSMIGADFGNISLLSGELQFANNTNSQGNQNINLSGTKFNGSTINSALRMCNNNANSTGNQTCNLSNIDFSNYVDENGETKTTLIQGIYAANNESSTGAQTFIMDGANFSGIESNNFTLSIGSNYGDCENRSGKQNISLTGANFQDSNILDIIIGNDNLNCQIEKREINLSNANFKGITTNTIDICRDGEQICNLSGIDFSSYINEKNEEKTTTINYSLAIGRNGNQNINMDDAKFNGVDFSNTTDNNIMIGFNDVNESKIYNQKISLVNADFRDTTIRSENYSYFCSNINGAVVNQECDLSGIDFSSSYKITNETEPKRTLIKSNIMFGSNFDNSGGVKKLTMDRAKFNGTIFTRGLYIGTNQNLGLEEENKVGNQIVSLTNADFRDTTFYSNDNYFCVNKLNSSGDQECDLANIDFSSSNTTVNGIEKRTVIPSITFGSNLEYSNGKKNINMSGANFSGAKINEMIRFGANENRSFGDLKVSLNGAKFNGSNFVMNFVAGVLAEKSSGNIFVDLSGADFSGTSDSQTNFSYLYLGATMNSYGSPSVNLSNAKFNNVLLKNIINLGLNEGNIEYSKPAVNVDGIDFSDTIFDGSINLGNINMCKIAATDSNGRISKICSVGTEDDVPDNVYNPYCHLNPVKCCLTWRNEGTNTEPGWVCETTGWSE